MGKSLYKMQIMLSKLTEACPSVIDENKNKTKFAYFDFLPFT